MALSELGNALVGPDFAIHGGDPVAAIAESLAAPRPCWCGTTSRASCPAATRRWTPRAAPAAGRGRGGRAAQGGSRLLITTRDVDFGHAPSSRAATAAHMPWRGLAPADALELAGQILADRGIERPARPSLEELIGFLGGHPLSLQLVLPHLADDEVKAKAKAENGDVVRVLIEEFDALLPGFREGKAAERNESLAVSLDFSLRRLGEDAGPPARAGGLPGRRDGGPGLCGVRLHAR